MKDSPPFHSMGTLAMLMLMELSKFLYNLILQNLFSAELAPVKRQNKWGYVNAKGEVVIDFRYDNAIQFDGDSAIVLVGNNYHIIDRQGKNRY